MTDRRNHFLAGQSRQAISRGLSVIPFNLTATSPVPSAQEATQRPGDDEKTTTERDRALQEARQLSVESHKLKDEGKYDQALSLAESVLATRERILGPDHIDVVSALNELAILYHIKGQYAKAESAFQRSLAILEKMRGPESPDFANTLNNLADLYQDMGKYEEAVPLFQRSLMILENARQPEDLDLAATLNNFALLYLSEASTA